MKNFDDYKRTVKLPIFTWLLERWFLYVPVILVGAFIISTTLFKGYNAYGHIFAVRPVVSEYIDVQSQGTVGKVWAKDFMNSNFLELESWTVNDENFPAHLFDSSCPQGQLSSSVLSTFKGSANGTQVTLQLVSSGYSMKQWETYKTSVKQCFGAFSELESANGLKGLKFAKGFVIVAGDVLLSVITTDDTNRDRLFDLAANKLKPSLIGSGCVNIVGMKTDDAGRNPYVKETDYTGYINSTDVETKISFDNVTKIKVPQMLDIKHKDLKEPEKPLPDNFPVLPKENVTKPAPFTVLETRKDFKEKALYHVDDTNGPACGWAWSAQKKPITDLKQLDKEKVDAFYQAQVKIDTDTINYLNTKQKESFDFTKLLLDIDNWNKYVKAVNETHEKWIWLNDKRTEFKPIWDQYVKEHNDWETFDQRKKDATDKYNTEVESCRKKQEDLDKWKELYEKPQATPQPEPTPTPSVSATPSPTPTVTIPPKPEICEVEPEKPEIVDQVKPDEPKEPSPPQNVTIPDSWRKQEQN